MIISAVLARIFEAALFGIIESDLMKLLQGPLHRFEAKVIHRFPWLERRWLAFKRWVDGKKLARAQARQK